MMVYCKDRSRRLPRRKKRDFTPKKESTVRPYYAPCHRELPSVLERRASRGQWLTKKQDDDEQEAARILAEWL
jgi:hypothetical protein